jgi:hypothetical protein
MIERPDMVELKRLYRDGKNLMKHLRESSGSAINTPEAILAAYDLQSGSYISSLLDSEHGRKHAAYAREISEILAQLGPKRMLESGMGEATTLCGVLRGLLNAGKNPESVAGIDLAWSRVNCARRYLRDQGLGEILIAVGDMIQAPYVDGAFDLVYTAHAIEPNYGREGAILRELARISHRWVVLFEPSYELGGDATRSRIEEHGYCRGLPELACELGLEVRTHRLLRNSVRPDNATAVLILEKRENVKLGQGLFGCPCCHARLEATKGHWFCGSCSLVYPTLDGIPCLLAEKGILATHFCDSE